MQHPRTARHRATLADVARAAGVSASTASLAVNGSGPVSPATRERVLAAARSLGYLGPDPLARSLRRGRCGVVAVVVGERLGYAFRDPMMVLVLDGLAEEIGAVGASLLLVPAYPGPPDGQGVAARLAALPMDAVVLADCGLHAADLMPGLAARGTVAVGVDTPTDPRMPLVRIDDAGATAALVDHLTGLGHRDLAVVSLPGGRPEATDGDAAEDGVPARRTRAALAAIGAVPGGRGRCAEAARNTVEEGERAAAALLDLPDPPSALVAQSDVLALGCLRAASARGLDVPGDVSVTGFDGVDLHLLAGTRLTTVEQPGTLKGRTAGRLVLAAMDGGRPPDVTLGTTLRIGTTTAPPRDHRLRRDHELRRPAAAGD